MVDDVDMTVWPCILFTIVTLTQPEEQQQQEEEEGNRLSE